MFTKVILVSLFFIGLIIAVIGYFMIYPNCPKLQEKEADDRILQQSNAQLIQDLQFKQKPGEIYADIFDQPTPWVHGIGIGFQRDPVRIG